MSEAPRPQHIRNWLSWARYAPAGLAMTAGLVLTLLAFQLVRHLERREMEADFVRRTTSLTSILNQAVQTRLLVLEAVRALLAGSIEVRQDEFQVAMEPFLEQVEGTQVIAWAPRTPASERSRLEETMRRQGLEGFRIQQTETTNKLSPGAGEEYLFPVTLVEPRKNPLLSLGRNLAAIPTCRTNIVKTRDRGEITAAKCFSPREGGEKTKTLVFFLPVYQNHPAPKTLEERRNRFRGIVIGGFAMDATFESSLEDHPPHDIDTRIYDASVPGGAPPLYDHPTRSRRRPGGEPDKTPFGQGSNLREIRTFDLAGRRLRVEYAPGPAFLAVHAHWYSGTVLLAGILSTALLGRYLITGVRRTGEVQSLVNKRTAEFRKSEALLRTIVRVTQDAMIAIGEDGRITLFNPAAADMFRCPADEMLGQTLDRLMPESYRDRHQEYVKNYFAKGKPDGAIGHIVELPGLRSDGTEFPMEVSLSEGRVGDRRVVIGVARDISERKYAERETQARKRIAEAFLRLSDDAMYGEVLPILLETMESEYGVFGYLDEKGDLVAPSLSRHVWEECEVPEKSILFPRETWGHSSWGRALREKNPICSNTPTTGIPEGHIPIRRHLVVPLIHQDRAIGLFTMANKPTDYDQRDVKLLEAIAAAIAPVLDARLQRERASRARRLAEAEAARLKGLLENVTNSMPSVLVAVDTEGRVTQWNRQAETLTGLSPGEARGRLLGDVFPWLADEMPRVRQAIRDHRTQHNTKVQREVEGQPRFSDITVYPLVTDGTEGAVIRVDDVTDRVRIEEMMIQSEKMLSVGGLAAGMAHEINNPLASILQNLQVARERTSSDLPVNRKAAEECGVSLETIRAFLDRRKIPQLLDAARESGRRAARIVENMLSFSRKGGSGMALNDIPELLDQTVELAASDYDLKKRYDFRQIEIERHYEPDLPQVACEKSKIQQVFLNLLQNGAEAMVDQHARESPPRFILRASREGDRVRIEVEDNGPGMDEAVRRRAFEPFFTTKEVGKGTGLGLSVSYFIITENHGGTMAVESTPGVGTKFVIRLPLRAEGKSPPPLSAT